MIFLENKILLFFAILFSLYIIIYVTSKIECRFCKINAFDIKNNKNADKLKLVFISDFHNKKYYHNYNVVIDKIISANPDYILLGGDFVDFSTWQSLNNQVKYKNTFTFIRNLTSRMNELKSTGNYNFKRILFGFGNHELRLKERKDSQELIEIYNSFIKLLKDNNIVILDDSSFPLLDGITISGLSLYKGYYGNIINKKVEYDSIDKSIIEKTFGDFDKSKFNIMAFHKPDYCEDFINFGFDLVLSGHNHGGLISFPFIGPLFSPDFKLFPKYNKGLYEYKGKHVVVSTGIGEHFIKIRVNNKPEICVVNIC